ncbi:hypothetical protein GCM10012275_00920 [Longimycelium tulufanense]|uniref:Uncharacterized protein n=1 Tax=Longimycelium tulufanense TaxID=907463 RepID=A0A8J3C5N0_9PSEU|nr:hypothetical protein [Longimycelium tulufanense]GGM33259.1 hypothetical protein GCM10012275_00920 [Longimycelium tulufanense]
MELPADRIGPGGELIRSDTRKAPVEPKTVQRHHASSHGMCEEALLIDSRRDRLRRVGDQACAAGRRRSLARRYPEPQVGTMVLDPALKVFRFLLDRGGDLENVFLVN